ncbi:MAG: hypothetical protein WBX03_16415 [Terriglobales bacterium]|jgi:hypothetical protein
MEPISTVTSAWTIAKTAGEISKKLYDFGKGLKDRDLKQQVDEILDSVRELKQSASELEDENRDLREKLRFKTDEYELRNPFYYHKGRPNEPLCPKCFATNIPAPVTQPVRDDGGIWRKCLVCNSIIWEQYFPSRSSVDYPHTGGEWS